MDPDDFTERSPGRLTPIGGGVSAFVPGPMPTSMEFTPATIRLLDRASRSLGELSGLGAMLPNANLLIQPHLRREAILSSRIEEKFATVQQLATFEAVAAEETPDVREVGNYAAALEYGLSRTQELPLSLRLIRELHERLLSGVRGEDQRPGEFRRTQNYIGRPGQPIENARYVPPPPPMMLDALYVLERSIYDDSELPPLIKIALMHYQFEAIHPFNDGNGRVGRLLITLQLHHEGLLSQPLLYLSAFFSAHQRGYYDRLLAVSRNAEWTSWVDYFLEGVAEQSRDAGLRARRLLDLREDFRHRVRRLRSPRFPLQLIDEMFQAPLVTAGHVARLLNVTPRSAQQIIGKLTTAGILREVTGRRRNRRYAAPEIIEVLEAPTA